MQAPFATDLQTRTLVAFTVLHQLRADWGGSLILSLGLNPQGSALAFAANIAGAVCLSLEADAATAHAALRSGACDFVVNSLDEALRAMKNEVRKHLPISVGLQGAYAEVLAELLERGVAPQLVVDLSGDPANAAAVQTFQSQGSQVLDFSSTPTPTDNAVLRAQEIVQRVMQQNDWSLGQFGQPTTSALRAFDAEISRVVPPGDALRTRWLHSAAKILPRETPIQRVLWLTPAESEAIRKVAI